MFALPFETEHASSYVNTIQSVGYGEIMQFSLGKKIQIAVTGIVAVLSILLGFFFPLRQEQQLHESFERATQSLAVTVALGVEIGLSNGDFSAMQNAIHFARQDAELSYVAVINDAGNVEASYPSNWESGEAPTEDVVSRRARITTPIFDGEVIVGRSTEALQASVTSVRWTAALASLLAILFGAVAAFLLARFIARPVRKLRDAAERVGAGDLDQQVDIDSEDEVGQLAEAFNSMVHDIRTYLHEARAAARAKSEFLATMSHEVRTPINGVMGMTHLLQDTSLNTEQQHYVEVIQTSSDSLLAIINDILDISKIESGQLQLETEPFELVTTIEHVLDLMAPKAASKDLELICRVGESVPAEVEGDVTRVRQVALNLLSNAIKFTNEGEVEVTIEAEPEGNDAWRVCLTVRDTGIGIPVEKQDQLFDKFTQADASMAREYGGTGLGLSICQQLCELMGGSVEVDSREGQGATFRATFVVGRIDTAMVREFPDEALHGRRVLIVGDNAAHRRVLAEYASQWEMNTLAADSADEALTHLNEAPVDVAVVDLDMSMQAGGVLLERIAHLDEAPPVVLLTPLGKAVPALPAEAVAAKVHKPVKCRAFHRALRDVLAEESSVEPDRPLRSISELEAQFGLHVLVAEDNAINQTVMRQMLERLGCEVEIVGDGTTALRTVKNRSFDLVLMDIQMPRMDGFEATRRLVAHHAEGERPYIASLTAHSMDNQRDKAAAAGMDDVLEKPVQPDALVALLQRVQQHASPDARNEAASNGCAAVDAEVAADIRAALHARIGADEPALVQALLNQFLATAPDVFQTLDAARESQDIEAIERAAHSFRTSSATVGASDVADAATRLEQLCIDDAEWSAIEAQIETLDAAFRDAEQTIRTLVAEDDR